MGGHGATSQLDNPPQKAHRPSGPCLAELSKLPIETDPVPNLDAAFDLAVRCRLAFYDALYLELSCRRRALLATIDAPLLAAARAEGVVLD